MNLKLYIWTLAQKYLPQRFRKKQLALVYVEAARRGSTPEE